MALRSQVTSPALSHSYIWQHIEIGYVQGMCDLLAPLLVILDDGEWVTFLSLSCVGICGRTCQVGGGSGCLEVWSRFVPGAHPGARLDFLEGHCCCRSSRAHAALQ